MIKIPSRKVATPSTTGARLIPARPQLARRVGSEAQRLGAALRQLGGDFVDLSDKITRTQIRTELAENQTLYAKDQRAYLSELNKDTEYAGRADKSLKWHDELTKTQIEAMKTDGAKTLYNKWAREQRNKLFTSVSTRAARLQAQNERSGLQREMEGAAKDGCFTDFELHLNQMVDDGNLLPEEKENWMQDLQEYAQKWNYEQLKQEAYNNAYQILIRTGDWEEAVAWINNEKNVPGLTPQDRYSLSYRIKLSEKFSELESDRVQAEEWKGQIDEITKMFVEKSSELPHRIEALPDGRRKNKFRKIVKGLTEPPKETNWKAYIDLEETLFDFWDGTMTKEELQEKLLEARGIDKNITDAELQTLLGRMGAQLSIDNITSLKKGFESIRRNIAADIWDRTIYTSQDEARRIAEGRKTLLDDILEKKGRKKEIKFEDVYRKSVEVSIPSRRVPTTPEEYEAAKKAGLVAFPKVTEKELEAAKVATQVETAKPPVAPAEESPEYPHYLRVRRIWYQLPIRIQVEIWAALTSKKNPAKWDEIAADDAVQPYLKEVTK